MNNSLKNVIRESTQVVKNNLPLSLLEFTPDFNANDIELPNSVFNTQTDRPSIRMAWNNLAPFSKDAQGCYIITEGVLSVDIRFPKGRADLVPTEAAEEIQELFLTAEFESFYVPDAVVLPLPEEDNWYIVRADITYHYEGYTNAN